jgi:hypothetical protein
MECRSGPASRDSLSPHERCPCGSVRSMRGAYSDIEFMNCWSYQVTYIQCNAITTSASSTGSMLVVADDLLGQHSIPRRSRPHLPAVVARDRTPRWTTLMWRKTISPGPLPCIGSWQLTGLVLYPEPTEEVRHVPIGCRSLGAKKRKGMGLNMCRQSIVDAPLDLKRELEEFDGTKDQSALIKALIDQLLLQGTTLRRLSRRLSL